MTIREKKLTIDEFWELAQRPEYSDKQLELIDGEVIIMSPSSGKNSKIAATIIRLIGNYVVEHDLGDVTSSDGGFVVSENTVLQPDAGFIQHSRIPDEEFVFYPVAPDLAVEVISPSETRPSIQQKTRIYLEGGTQVVWNVYPEGQTVDVVTLGEGGELVTQTLSVEQTISGEPALVGFSVSVGEFFA